MSETLLERVQDPTDNGVYVVEGADAMAASGPGALESLRRELEMIRAELERQNQINIRQSGELKTLDSEIKENLNEIKSRLYVMIEKVETVYAFFDPRGTTPIMTRLDRMERGHSHHGNEIRLFKKGVWAAIGIGFSALGGLVWYHDLEPRIWPKEIPALTNQTVTVTDPRIPDWMKRELEQLLAPTAKKGSSAKGKVSGKGE
jgi:hypothetical protein